MSSKVKRQRFQDSDEEDNFLKIHYYQESTKFFEVPIYDNGTVSFTDITLMDSNIFALILQKEDGYRRLIKPKNGNWREPKEKWDFFKVYAALKQQPEHTSNTLNENLNSTAKAAFNLNKNIKAEIPTMSVIVPQDNAELQQPNTLSSVPNSENRINNSKIKAETSTVLDTIQQKVPEPHHSSESAMHDDESETEIEVSATNDMTSTDGYDSVTDDKGSASRITTIDSPNDAQIFSAYKVSSFEELRYMLCRGDTKMKKKFFEQTVKLFKRTIIAYPNNEIIRLIYWLRKCEMKNLDLYTQEYCKVCENGSKMSVGHLFSLQHLKAHSKKYNADPPEIAKFFDPEIYKQFIDPTVLGSLKIPEFKEMEESPEFSIKNSSRKTELAELKYSLINRILEINLKISYNTTFSVQKLLFLQENTKLKISLKVFKFLRQAKFDRICKAMSNVEETSEGFRFLSLSNSNIKRPSKGAKKKW